jgi:DNA-binding NtrC family response regulator
MLRVATLLESSESVEPRHLPSISTAKEAIESKPTLLHSDTNMNVSLYDLSGKTLREVECAAVCAALDASGGKRAAAAKQLGVSEKTIYNLIKRYQI